MKIVAFMQNMWVRNPAKAQRQIDRDQTGQLRERMIAYALFAGCLTGRRLKQCLGENLCEQIVWEEANPTIADNPRDYYQPDVAHIRRVLEKHKPDTILCLTMTGRTTLEAECVGLRFVAAYHPTSRHPQTLQRLIEVRKILEAQ